MRSIAELLDAAIRLHQGGQWEQAESRYRQALALEPNLYKVHNNLGLVLQARNQPEQAMESFQKAVDLNPDYPNARNNLGAALSARGELDAALGHFRQALRIDPEHAQAQLNMGRAVLKQGRPTEAIDFFRRFLRRQPDHVIARNDLGVALGETGALAEAVASFTAALRLDPQHIEAHNNLANAYMWLGQPAQARAHTHQALAINPDDVMALLTRALLRLQDGDFEQGWPDYEARCLVPEISPFARTDPRWQGEPLAGKMILLSAEQGLGDTIQFIRYAALVKERGGTVVFECPRSLMRLLANVPGVDRLVPVGSALPRFDVQAPLLSLPGIFHTTLANVPAPVPYLQAEKALVQSWREKLQGAAGIKIGIAWQGNPGRRGDYWRSCPLAHFARLAQVPRVRLVSLQKGPGADETGHAVKEVPLLDLGEHLDREDAFVDTAAVIMSLDLVVTIDTAVAHLAGALGVPVWVILPYGADWRWLLERSDSPWYPTMRLFRQKSLGAWEEVLERVAVSVRGMGEGIKAEACLVNPR